MKLGVFGLSGFIGNNLAKVYKKPIVPLSFGHKNWPEKLSNSRLDVVLHLAGPSNILGISNEDLVKSNDFTRELVTQAVKCGIKRLVFLSSIRAVAPVSSTITGLKRTDCQTPICRYGKLKMEDENIIRRASAMSEMEVVVIRSPLVFGPGVKANIRRLIRLIEQGVPLPLSALDSNRRSLVGITNLIDLILLCLEHPAAENQTFHVSDDEDISTAELLRRIGKALGKPVKSFPLPGVILQFGLRLVGKGEWVDKLCRNLQVDISETKRILGWKPKVTMEKELERTARWWRSRER